MHGSAAVVLLYAWWSSRDARPLLAWSLSNLAGAFGVFLALLGATLGGALWFAASGTFLTIQAGLAWSGIRMSTGRKARLWLTGAGILAAFGAGAVPGFVEAGITGAVGFAINATFYYLGAYALWIERQEHLAARWPLIGLMVLHGSLLLNGAYYLLTRDSTLLILIPLNSAFGMIHFETIIFGLGTAAFVLAMAKERNDLANRRAARMDGLTGIANRQTFMDGAERTLRRCQSDGLPMSVIMFDLDRFKMINDTFGHGAGDRVIQAFAEVVRQAMRPTDIFGRVGGEEFAVAMPGADIEAAFARAELVRLGFEEVDKGVDIMIASVSAGVAVATGVGPTLRDVLVEADGALYRAKAEGRNRVVKAETRRGGKTILRVA